MQLLKKIALCTLIPVFITACSGGDGTNEYANNKNNSPTTTNSQTPVDGTNKDVANKNNPFTTTSSQPPVEPNTYTLLHLEDSDEDEDKASYHFLVNISENLNKITVTEIDGKSTNPINTIDDIKNDPNSFTNQIDLKSGIEKKNNNFNSNNWIYREYTLENSNPLTTRILMNKTAFDNPENNADYAYKYTRVANMSELHSGTTPPKYDVDETIFIFGSYTPKEKVLTGSATYNGSILGYIESNGVDTTILNKITISEGDFVLKANFDNKQVSGVANFDKANQEIKHKNPKIQDMYLASNFSFNGKIVNRDGDTSHKGFDGKIDNDKDSDIYGYFMGPNAEEVAGSYMQQPTEIQEKNNLFGTSGSFIARDKAKTGK